MNDAGLKLAHPRPMTRAPSQVQEEGWSPGRCPGRTGKRWAFTGRGTGTGVVTGSADRSHRAGAEWAGGGLCCKYRGASNAAPGSHTGGCAGLFPQRAEGGPEIHAV